MLLKQRICIEFADEEATEFLNLLRFCKKALTDSSIITKSNPEEDECDVHGAARVTGRKVSTIYGDVHAKSIPHFRRGRKLLFSKKALLAWKIPAKTAQEIEAEASNYIVNRKK